MKLRSAVIGVATAAFLIPSVASLDYDPLKDFCRRFYHQAAQIKNRLYIDGGFINLSGNAANYTNEQLLFHDLSDDSKGIPPLVNNLTKPGSVPSVVGGQLWVDETNEKLYLYGGEYPTSPLPPDSSALWSYDPWSDTWTRMPVSQTLQRPSFGAGTSVEHLGVGYYLGGWLGPQNLEGYTGDRYAVSGLISYNMVTNTFRNDTGPSGPPRVEGVLLYVPTGDDGLLIAFGGLYVTPGETPVGAPMTDIDVYDINQRRWTRVQASGDVPESRRLFCGGLSSAADGSSHNAYIYGGASTSSSSPGSDDIYILTMPAFKWVRMWLHEPPSYHNGFTCNVINKGQMIVLGGTFPHDDNICDAPEVFGAHNMDLGRQNSYGAAWVGYRRNLTTYAVPRDLIDIIGGDSDGGATVTAPDGGFNSSDLQTLFARTIEITARTPTRTPSSRAGNETDMDGTTLAVIVGPSVGVGVPVIAGLIGVFFLYRRKKAREEKFRDKRQLYVQTGEDRIQAYQLPTTQSPITSPAGYFPEYQYPINPYPMTHPAILHHPGFQPVLQPYMYHPPFKHHISEHSTDPVAPQELPASRASVAPIGTMKYMASNVEGPPNLPAGDKCDIIECFGKDSTGECGRDLKPLPATPEETSQPQERSKSTEIGKTEDFTSPLKISQAEEHKDMPGGMF